MLLTPARIRAIVVPTILVVGLLGAPSAFAAGEPADTSAVTIAGTGTLSAQGDGHARLAGSYTLTGSLDGGILSIRGLTRYTAVRVTGWISKTRFADGSVLYRFGDRTGHYVIAGRTLVTNIESDAMRFTATGRGRATLVGEGTFWVNGHGPFPWSSPDEAAPETEF
jgi:hypothetical protein